MKMTGAKDERAERREEESCMSERHGTAISKSASFIGHKRNVFLFSLLSPLRSFDSLVGRSAGCAAQFLCTAKFHVQHPITTISFGIANSYCIQFRWQFMRRGAFGIRNLAFGPQMHYANGNNGNGCCRDVEQINCIDLLRVSCISFSMILCAI